MKNEIKKGEQWRKGYQAGVKETEKAFGSCKSCYGKGYATTLEFAEGSEDFGGDAISRHQLPIIRFCDCSRGKQLMKYWHEGENIIISKMTAVIKKKNK